MGKKTAQKQPEQKIDQEHTKGPQTEPEAPVGEQPAAEQLEVGGNQTPGAGQPGVEMVSLSVEDLEAMKAKAREEALAEVKSAPAADQPKGDKTPATVEDMQKVRAKIQMEEFERVCRAMGLDPKDIEAKEEAQKKLKLVKIKVNLRGLKINGREFYGNLTVREDVAETLQKMMADRKERVLNEVIPRDYIVQMINNNVRSKEVTGNFEELFK